MSDLWAGQRKDLDHPKIFIGWCKHPMFFDKGGNSDIGSCYDLPGVEGKRDDHWMGMSKGKICYCLKICWVVTDFLVGDLLIDAGPGSDIGQKIQREDWGEAHGTPINTHNSLC